MADKWTKINRGYGESPLYKGFGWTIDAETYPLPHAPKCYIDIPTEMAEEIEGTLVDGYSADGKYLLKKFGNVYSLGFFKVADAKAWAEEHKKD